MSLLNLKSIFSPTEGDTKFQDNQPKDNFDTKLDYNSYSFSSQTFSVEADLTKRSGRQDPILDSLLRGRIYEPIRFSQNIIDRNFFVLPEIKPFTNNTFKTQTFDPRASTPKEGTIYFNTGHSFNPATNPTDFSTAGSEGSPFIPLSQLGVQFYNGEDSPQNLSWESLYNSNHTPKDNPKWQGGNLEALHYGPNINRDNLKIGVNTTLYGDRSGALGSFGRDNEPYIVSGIGEDGRQKNNGGFTSPFRRQTTDTSRILSFLESDEGLGFMVRQNSLGLTTKVQFLSKDGKLQSSTQRWRKGYNPVSTLAAVRSRIGGVPNPLVEKDEPRFGALLKKRRISLYDGTSMFAREYGTVVSVSGAGGMGKIEQGVTVPFTLQGTFENGTVEGPFNFSNLGDKLMSKVKSAVNNLLGEPETIKEKSSGGDRATLTPLLQSPSDWDSLYGAEADLSNDSISGFQDRRTIDNYLQIDYERDGMPMYFKDLRNRTYLFFRAFIEGLTETISPTWTPHNYIGRSEPVYTYERGEREINFTLKLVAQTADELEAIYKKMEVLSSLCYPEYMYLDDSDNSGDSTISAWYGNRMKPPLTKFRLGELYGTTDRELTGFIKGLTYTSDNTSPWETEVGKRVPKHVTATLTYQVIHDQSPNIYTKFYGTHISNYSWMDESTPE